MITTVEEELLNGSEALIQTTGISMEPMLHNRKSSVVLKKADEALKKNDVVLFKRGEELVLHRIVKVKKDFYIIRGDNCIGSDKVYDNQIIGVMKGFFPNESAEYVTSDNKKYKSYIKTVPFRFAVIVIKFCLKTIYYSVFGSNRRS